MHCWHPVYRKSSIAIKVDWQSLEEGNLQLPFYIFVKGAGSAFEPGGAGRLYPLRASARCLHLNTAGAQ